MKLAALIIALALAVCQSAECQTLAGSKPEFDAVAIKAAAPQAGHFRSPASSVGGPGTTDPTLFRCSNCTVSFLITKAFALERYQFPGQSSLPDTAFDISAKVPDGATLDQFAAMLQSLLKERFNLSHHYEKKQVQGYELVVAKNGPKLQESKESTKPPGVETGGGGAHQGGSGTWHSAGNESRPGLMFRNGQGIYRGEHETTADLARMISNQLAKPVDDHTGLQGKYDINLSWADDGSHAASHPGGWGGGPAAGGGHGDHGGAPQGSGAGSTTDSTSGSTLVGAVQTQLGLKLEPRKATASVFVVDHVDKSPTAN